MNTQHNNKLLETVFSITSNLQLWAESHDSKLKQLKHGDGRDYGRLIE